MHAQALWLTPDPGKVELTSKERLRGLRCKKFPLGRSRASNNPSRSRETQKEKKKRSREIPSLVFLLRSSPPLKSTDGMVVYCCGYPRGELSFFLFVSYEDNSVIPPFCDDTQFSVLLPKRGSPPCG